MLQPMQLVDERATRYATVTDFFATFNEEMRSLYLLAFLLTADHDKAEECLVHAMGECVEWIGVFTDWAHSWSRRAVLKRAIQMIMPAPEHADKVSIITLKSPATSGEDNDPFAAILLLDPFERFVFVMSTLEGQSDADCAVLLRCSRRDVMMARVLALKRQSSPDALAGTVLQS
jgi:DNA-directed RNA polymerase specialized sigma24 family protein